MEMPIVLTPSVATTAPVSLVTLATEPVAMTLTSVLATIAVTTMPPVLIMKGASPVSATVDSLEMDSTAHVSQTILRNRYGVYIIYGQTYITIGIHMYIIMVRIGHTISELVS